MWNPFAVPENIRAAVAATAAHFADLHAMEDAGRDSIRAVHRACVRDEDADAADLKRGLAALVAGGR